jgi:hypothetical protein
MRVVIDGERRDHPVLPGQHTSAALLTAIGHVTLPVGGAARQIDQEPVEPVPLLEFGQRPDEHVAVEPDVGRRVVAVQEKVSQCQLAHHRHAIRDLVPHSFRDSLFSVHGVVSWQ